MRLNNSGTVARLGVIGTIEPANVEVDFSRYVVNRVTFDVSYGTVTPLPVTPLLAPGESGLYRYWKNRGTTEGGTA